MGREVNQMKEEMRCLHEEKASIQRSLKYNDEHIRELTEELQLAPTRPNPPTADAIPQEVLRIKEEIRSRQARRARIQCDLKAIDERIHALKAKLAEIRANPSTTESDSIPRKLGMEELQAREALIMHKRMQFGGTRTREEQLQLEREAAS